MAEVIKLVQGDSRPSLVVTLTDKHTGFPINLTEASVVLKFREQGALIVTGIVPGSIIDPPGGICIFNWGSVPGILDGTPGVYEGEIEITYQGTVTQSVYELIYFYLREQF